MIEKIESSNSNCNTRGVNGGSGDDTSVWCQHHHHHPTVLARYAGGGSGAGGTDGSGSAWYIVSSQCK